MKKNELGVLEETKKVIGISGGFYSTSSIFWVVVSLASTKKVTGRYGPFKSSTEACRWAKEHHIDLGDSNATDAADHHT